MKGWNRVNGSYAIVLAPRPRRPVTRLMKVVPNERIHKHKMYGKDDDEAILYYYQAETRRKYKTTFEGVLLLLNSTCLAFSFKISPNTFKRPLLDGQIVHVIEHVFTRECRMDKRPHTTDKDSTHILSRYQFAIYQACSVADDCRVFKVPTLFGG